MDKDLLFDLTYDKLSAIGFNRDDPYHMEKRILIINILRNLRNRYV